MFSFYSRRSLPLAAACLLLWGVSMAAPVIIENGAQSAEGVKTVGMTELWRAGGEDDDVFFGTLGAVRTDRDGLIYLLDSQLSEVHVYTPDGEYVKTVGREGDGPGEMRRPGDMFISDDGLINVLQSMPGRIIKLTPEGLPAGEASYSAGSDGSGQFAVLLVGRAAGEDILMAGIRMTFSGAISEQIYFLSRCDSEGQQKAALLEKKHVINYAEFKMDELEMDFIWGRVAVGPKGKVYAGTERNNYLINVYGADGTIERSITREYTSPARNENQKKVARQIIEAVGANYPRPPMEITIEDTEPVLGNLTVTDDGRIWAQTSTGNINTPEGTWVVLDVFTPDGKFEKQVALRGDHNPGKDGINILPGGRVIVIVGALDAWLNQQGATGKEAEVQEGDPLEVICYQLDW